MGTTANNNWPTPVQTDLVKDGWEAIKDLGDAIDTTLGVYAPSTSGLTLINTTTFSGVASQSINDVFSATYDNYVLLLNITNNTSNSDIKMRLRVAGSDTSADYDWSHFVWSSANAQSNSGATAQNYMNVANVGNGLNRTSYALNVYMPFLTAPTKVFASGIFHNGSNHLSGFYGASHTASTSFTGFTLFPGAGNMTGTLSTYGANK